MNSIKIAIIFYILFANIALWAQPARDWDLSVGSSNWDEMRLLVPLADDAYLLGGGISGTGGNTSIAHFGYYEGYVEVRSKTKEKLWSAAFGGTEDDKFHCALPLADGSFLLGGYSASPPSGNKTSVNYGKKDFWIVKVNATGQKIWEKTYGGTEDDEIFCMTELSNGDFLLVGVSASGADGVKTEQNMGKDDIWMLRIAADGALLMQQALGGDLKENLYEIIPTADGGFLACGATKSAVSSTVSQPSQGTSDYWVVKLDADGLYLWDKRFGGVGDDQLYDAVALKKGGFVLTGTSNSGVSGDKTSPNLGNLDYWVVKIDDNGSLLWQANFGGNGLDVPYAAVETLTGHIYVAGVSDSPSGPYKLSNNIGSYDYWLLLLDPAGNALWDKCYGGALSDALTKMEMNANGSLMLAGNSMSNSSAFKSEDNIGFNDFWLLKTYCGVSLEIETDKPFYCEGADVVVQAKPFNCAGAICDIYWNNGTDIGNDWTVQANNLQSVEAILRDKNGCTASAQTLIHAMPQPTISLGNDTTLRVGTSYVISASVLPLSNDYQFLWNTGDTNASKIIKETGNYAITVSNDAGCFATDSVNVCICLDNSIYIPNVFKPDFDLSNDIWYVLGNDKSVEIINSIQIIDNWGTIVYNKQNIAINDKANGWTGIHQGKLLPPGVFLYAVDVQYIDGKSEVLFGTVTLVR